MESVTMMKQWFSVCSLWSLDQWQHCHTFAYELVSGMGLLVNRQSQVA